jgi:hypothetical protein
MSDSRTRILEMLAQNKITVDEAERLLTAIGTNEKVEEKTSSTTTLNGKMPKYLRVVIEPGPDCKNGEIVERVNIRVPMGLIKAGMKLTSLIPSNASDKMNEAMREKGVDFDLKNFKPEDVDELIAALSELEVNVDGKEKVRVFVES